MWPFEYESPEFLDDHHDHDHHHDHDGNDHGHGGMKHYHDGEMQSLLLPSDKRSIFTTARVGPGLLSATPIWVRRGLWSKSRLCLTTTINILLFR